MFCKNPGFLTRVLHLLTHAEFGHGTTNAFFAQFNRLNTLQAFYCVCPAAIGSLATSL
jgi:hypothetical protein